MKRSFVSQCIDQIGQKVLIKGFVSTIREHGKIAFGDIRDLTGTVQVVDETGKLAKVKGEYAVEIVGTVSKRGERYINKKIATGTIEIQLESIKVLAESSDLPFEVNKPKIDVSLPVLLDYRNASLRNQAIADVFRLQSNIVKAFRDFMYQQKFIEIQAPTMVATATEGGSQVFSVDYFDRKVYMAQSPQFYKQIMVSIFERVFTVAHAYRAEPSVTTRHLTEYVGLDVEMGFIDSWMDVLLMADSLVKHMFETVKKENGDILEEYGVEVPQTCKNTPIVKLSEAQEIVFERTGRDIRGEPDMDPEAEREICRWALEKHKSDLVFVSHFPTKKRPWYTYPDPESPEETLSFDLIGKGVEWITGGQRINDYKQLITNIKKMGANPDDFEIPYLQAFKYGMPPEGGFCIGLERITQNILGLENIRQASLYPRDMERVDIRLAKLDEKNNSK